MAAGGLARALARHGLDRFVAEPFPAAASPVLAAQPILPPWPEAPLPATAALSEAAAVSARRTHPEPHAASAPAAPPSIPPPRAIVLESPPAGTGPMLLPLCGDNVKIAVGDTIAVLHFETAAGQPVLVPVPLDTLGRLNHEVAGAMMTARGRPAVRRARY